MENPIIGSAVSSLIGALLQQFLMWQMQRARDVDWKPSLQDATDFMNQVDADTPEAIKARVAAELGLPWPPTPPPS